MNDSPAILENGRYHSARGGEKQRVAYELGISAVLATKRIENEISDERAK